MILALFRDNVSNCFFVDTQKNLVGSSSMGLEPWPLRCRCDARAHELSYESTQLGAGQFVGLIWTPLPPPPPHRQEPMAYDKERTTLLYLWEGVFADGLFLDWFSSETRPFQLITSLVREIITDRTWE